MTTIDTATTAPRLTADQAQRLTDDIKTDLGSLAANIAEAFTGRAWEALGYDTWDAYTAAEFTLDQFRLPKGAERGEVLAVLREAGMSQRQIASATGLSQATISRAIGDSNESVDVRQLLNRPDGWRAILADPDHRRAAESDSPPPDATSKAWANHLVMHIRWNHARLASELDEFNTRAPQHLWGDIAEIRGVVEICLDRMPLVWSPVRQFLRNADLAGFDVRGAIQQMVVDDGADSMTLRRASDAVALLDDLHAGQSGAGDDLTGRTAEGVPR